MRPRTARNAAFVNPAKSGADARRSRSSTGAAKPLDGRGLARASVRLRRLGTIASSSRLPLRHLLADPLRRTLRQSRSLLRPFAVAQRGTLSGAHIAVPASISV